MYNTIVPGWSCWETCFTTNTEEAIKIAATIGNTVNHESSTKPGRRITNVPANPQMVADHRRHPTFSASTSAAPSVTNNGMVKLSATASARGRYVREVNHRVIAIKLINDLMPCNFRCLVRKQTGPLAMTHGNIKTSAKKFRKKTICNGLSSLEAQRIIKFITEKQKAAPTI